MLARIGLLTLVGLGIGSAALAKPSADSVTFKVSSHQVVGVDTSTTLTVMQIDACAARKLEDMTNNNVGKLLRVTLDGTEITRARVLGGAL